jgi:hypothetical protein
VPEPAKKRVRILMSIAGLGDPDTAALDRKYQKVADRMTERAANANATLKPQTIKAVIDEYKKQDRYSDVKRGFKSDFSFAPGAEVSIPAAVADAWEEAGICTILADTPDKKASA